MNARLYCKVKHHGSAATLTNQSETASKSVERCDVCVCVFYVVLCALCSGARGGYYVSLYAN